MDTDYEIKEKIGEGSFGSVYRIQHKALKLERALKKIKKTSNEAFSTFEEIEVLKELDHRNILKIYEFYETKDAYLIVTDLFDGKELFDEIIE